MTLSNALEIAIHRKNTKRFIDADPTPVTLIPRGKKVYVDGTATFVQEPARPEQICKIIWQWDNGVNREISQSTSGSRRFDFVILGTHDAVIEIGDYWVVGEQTYVVEYVFPFNDYEVKAGGVTFGSKPKES